MTSTARFRLALFVTLFALRDIFPVSWYGRNTQERLRTLGASLRSCVSAFLNLTTLMILVVTTLLVASLYWGTVTWLRDYVESNPLARTVEVAAMFDLKTATFKPEDLKVMAVKPVEGKDSPVSGAFGWNDVTFWFYDADGGRDDTLTHGRTVDLNDPVLRRMDYVAGAPSFEGDGLGQIIVSASLLRNLGYEPTELPESFQLDYSELAAPLQVIAVVAGAPAGEFLVTETFHRAMADRWWDPLPRVPGFYFGPLEPSEDTTRALDAFESYLARRGAEVEWVRRNGEEQWLLFTRDEPWTEPQWRELFLPSLQRRFGEDHRIEWIDPLPPEIEARRRLAIEYHRASVYVDRLHDVPMVADELTAQGFRVTSNTRELALLFLQISSLGQGMLLAVILVVGGLSAVSLVLSFSQNIQRKTPQIAILKAFGASNRLVLGTYVLEATILWVLAVAVALPLTWSAAELMDRVLVDLLHLQGHMAPEEGLIAMPWLLQGSVVGGALFLCVAATVTAGSMAVRLQPAQALNLHR